MKKKRITIFIEAKVKTYIRNKWSIKSHFNSFTANCFKPTPPPSLSSNLFFQLYSKTRLTELVRYSCLTGAAPSKIKISFNIGKIKIRIIGNNIIVEDAVLKLKKFASYDDYYVMLIPGESKDINDFFLKTLKSNSVVKKIRKWNINNWGYLTWKEVEDFCKANKLINTNNVFDFNKGQIY